MATSSDRRDREAKRASAVSRRKYGVDARNVNMHSEDFDFYTYYSSMSPSERLLTASLNPRPSLRPFLEMAL